MAGEKWKKEQKALGKKVHEEVKIPENVSIEKIE